MLNLTKAPRSSTESVDRLCKSIANARFIFERTSLTMEDAVDIVSKRGNLFFPITAHFQRDNGCYVLGTNHALSAFLLLADNTPLLTLNERDFVFDSIFAIHYYE